MSMNWCSSVPDNRSACRICNPKGEETSAAQTLHTSSPCARTLYPRLVQLVQHPPCGHPIWHQHLSHNWGCLFDTNPGSTSDSATVSHHSKHTWAACRGQTFLPIHQSGWFGMIWKEKEKHQPTSPPKYVWEKEYPRDIAYKHVVSDTPTLSRSPAPTSQADGGHLSADSGAVSPQMSTPPCACGEEETIKHVTVDFLFHFEDSEEKNVKQRRKKTAQPENLPCLLSQASWHHLWLKKSLSKGKI